MKDLSFLWTDVAQVAYTNITKVLLLSLFFNMIWICNSVYRGQAFIFSSVVWEIFHHVNLPKLSSYMNWSNKMRQQTLQIHWFRPILYWPKILHKQSIQITFIDNKIYNEHYWFCLFLCARILSFTHSCKKDVNEWKSAFSVDDTQIYIINIYTREKKKIKYNKKEFKKIKKKLWENKR